MYLVSQIYLSQWPAGAHVERQHTSHSHPKRRSQLLAVLLTSLHSGPPLTQSRSIQQIYCSADEDQASTLITDLPLSVRVSGVEQKGRLLAEAETLNKWTWPADVGGSAILVYAGLSWEMGLCDAEIVSSIRQWQKWREREREIWISPSVLTESASFFRPLGKQYPAVPLYFDQPNERCWHFLWSGDCLSIYIKIFMLIRGQTERIFKPG